jgi:sulfur carrier protein ThiS
MNEQQKKLNEIILKCKAQPVGNGYIDIIVSRIYYKQFITEIIESGFIIEAISWWEFSDTINKSKYGMGGPKSRYYDGWFSEIPVSLDEITIQENEKIQAVIENKKIQFQNETIAFDKNRSIVPGFWIQVPDEWKSE